MAKSPPKEPQKAKKDPARPRGEAEHRIKPTRAKAARPDAAATPDSLADLLNPDINKGAAGLGSGTGPDSSLRGARHQRVDAPRRRATAGEPEIRKQPRSEPPDSGSGSASRPGMTEASGLQPPPDNSWDRRQDFSAAHRARQSAQTGQGFAEARQSDYGASPISGLDPALAKELGLDADDDSLPSPAGGGSNRRQAVRGGVSDRRHRNHPHPDRFAIRPPPSRGR